MDAPTEGMRIGEFSRRVGVSAHVLRAWEQRYGVLRPSRTPGGYRVYGPGDEARLRAVVALVRAGVPASAAVARALATERQGLVGAPGAGAASDQPAPSAFRADSLAAIARFDEPGAHDSLDRLLRARPFEEAIEAELMPLLADLGDLWADRRMCVAQEHFASQLIRRRLGALTDAWSRPRGSIAVLACLPGEHHDIPLLCLGVLLGHSGWRVRYLGADTPVADVGRAADAVKPQAVVLAATQAGLVRRHGADIAELARRYPVGLAGRGASGPLPPGVRRLAGTVTETLSDLAVPRRPGRT